MDTTKAVILLAVAGGLIELTKAMLPAKHAKNPRVLVGVVVVASIAATFLLRYSVWANEQVVNDRPLDTLDIPSLLVVSVFVAAAQSAGYLILRGAKSALSNIGMNQATPIPAAQRPKPGTVTEPQPPTDPAPMPTFTGDNATVDSTGEVVDPATITWPDAA